MRSKFYKRHQHFKENQEPVGDNECFSQLSTSRNAENVASEYVQKDHLQTPEKNCYKWPQIC